MKSLSQQVAIAESDEPDTKELFALSSEETNSKARSLSQRAFVIRSRATGTVF